MNKEIQEVEVYIGIMGDYCAFHEIGLYVVYDVTNNKPLNGFEETLEELDNHEFEEYRDYEKRDAVLIDGKYYVKL